MRLQSVVTAPPMVVGTGQRLYLSSSFFDQSMVANSFREYAVAMTCLSSADAASLLLGVICPRHFDTHSLTRQ